MRGGEDMGNKGMHMVTWTLLVIGGLNWLLYGIFGWEIGSWLGGMDSTVAKIIYILIGLSALYAIFTHKECCKHCDAKSDVDADKPAMPNM